MSSSSALLSVLRIGAVVTGAFYGEFRHMYLVSKDKKYVEKKTAYEAAEKAKAATAVASVVGTPVQQ